MNDKIGLVFDGSKISHNKDDPNIFEDIIETAEGRIRFAEAGQYWCYARAGWQNSGFSIQQGQRFSLGWFAHGYKPVYPNSPYSYWDVRWTANPNATSYGAEGSGIVAPAGYVLPGESEGALVYRIGNGEARSVRGIQTADQSGTINLIINDDINGSRGDGFADNKGRISVILMLH